MRVRHTLCVNTSNHSNTELSGRVVRRVNKELSGRVVGRVNTVNANTN